VNGREALLDLLLSRGVSLLEDAFEAASARMASRLMFDMVKTD